MVCIHLKLCQHNLPMSSDSLLLYCSDQAPILPNLTVLWFFEVFHVTAHHAKFLDGAAKVHSLYCCWACIHNCYHSDTFQAPLYTSGSESLQTPVCIASSVVLLACTKFAYCKLLSVGRKVTGQVHFLVLLPLGLALLAKKKAQVKQWCGVNLVAPDS